MELAIRGELVDNDSADIMRWLGWRDLCCPMDVQNALDNLPEGEELTLLINSPGGDMTVGTEIYSILRRSARRTTALVQGFAASAATLLMQGADSRNAEPGALICIHNPSLCAEGDYRDLGSAAESAENAREAILDIYGQRASLSREELGSLMDRDIWISAGMAAEYGLLDRVEPYGEGAEPDSETMVASAGRLPRITAKMRADFSAYRENKKEREKLEARQRQLRLR